MTFFITLLSDFLYGYGFSMGWAHAIGVGSADNKTVKRCISASGLVLNTFLVFFFGGLGIEYTTLAT